MRSFGASPSLFSIPFLPSSSSLFPFPSLPLCPPLPTTFKGVRGVLKLSKRVRAEAGRKTTLVHFGLKKVLLVRANLVQFIKLLQHIKHMRFDGENFKTEANFYGCLAPTIFPMDARASKHPRSRRLWVRSKQRNNNKTRRPTITVTIAALMDDSFLQCFEFLILVHFTSLMS